MRVNPVYRNLLFSPKIWGINFYSLITCMLILIFSFMFFGGIGILTKFLISAGLTGLTYVFFYWRDNRDQVAYHAKKNCTIKKVVGAYSGSNRFLRILDNE